DGIKLHKDKSPTSRQMAWECFKYHAETLKDPRAIYCKGYYLLEEPRIQKNELKIIVCEAIDLH
ncbi:3802_t:CDS:1, partial [Entrophospora sp. SA101]